jgi:hypothetical protein
MMFLRLLCCKGEERILRHTVGAIYTTITPTRLYSRSSQIQKLCYRPLLYSYLYSPPSSLPQN